MKRASATAKINLALVVGPRRDDGYHEVATVLQRIDLADRIELEPAPTRCSVDRVRRRHARAARARAARGAETASRAGTRASRSSIPVAAGLGGGSSDAATALALANETLASRCRRALHELAARARLRRAVLPHRRPAARHGRRAPTSSRSTCRRTTGSCSCCRTTRSKPSTAAVYDAFDARRRASTNGAHALLDALAARHAAPRDLAALPPNDLATLAARRRASRARRVPRRRQRRRPDRLRALHARARSGGCSALRLRAAGGPGSRLQRGTVERDVERRARDRPRQLAAGRWLRAARVRIALWIAGHRGRSLAALTHDVSQYTIIVLGLIASRSTASGDGPAATRSGRSRGSPPRRSRSPDRRRSCSRTSSASSCSCSPGIFAAVALFLIFADRTLDFPPVPGA